MLILSTFSLTVPSMWPRSALAALLATVMGVADILPLLRLRYIQDVSRLGGPLRSKL
jgi:hypothetical protein